MKRVNTLILIVLSVGLLLNCDDAVPMLGFPVDIVSRNYKIGNVAIGEDPTDPIALMEAFALIEGFSQGGSNDIGVVTVPTWINWDGYMDQEHVDFVTALRDYDVEVHYVVDPLPHRTFLGDQDPPPPGSKFENPAVRQAFKDYSLDVIAQIEPEYISLGTEINMYYHDAGIPDFVHLNSLINETADLIRSVSPETKIITSVQWEHLLLFSVSNGWEPIENFEWNIDILGISSFPMAFLKYVDPSKLPPNYYTQIFSHFPPNHTPETLAIAFTEVGFPSRPEQGYDGSEKHQNNGVVTFIERAAQFEHLEFVDYWYLHDHDGFERQTSFGLIESTVTPGGTPGKRRPSFYIWEQLGQLPYTPNPIR